MVPNIYQAFIWRAEVLINGDYYLFGQGGKLYGLPLGSILPGRKAQTSLECTYSHQERLLLIN
jgi:hypothetical protein